MVELSADEKIALAGIRFEKSKNMLYDAVNNFRAGMFKTSVNRSYYAVLHAARTLLILKGIDPVRHEGVKAMISLHYIKTAVLPKDIFSIFKSLNGPQNRCRLWRF